MAWPRIKNSRSSALPGTHQHSGVQVTVTPAPDTDPALEDGRNIGVSGTRHSVVDPPSTSEFGPTAVGYGNGGDDDADAELDQTQALAYDDDEPVDSGIAILGGMTTTVVPGDAPTAPQPALNVPVAQDPPRPVGDEPIPQGPPGPGFGTGYGG